MENEPHEHRIGQHFDERRGTGNGPQVCLQCFMTFEQITAAERLDELKQLSAKHVRTYRQTVTGPDGAVYTDDSHGYISKYETQERIAELEQMLNGSK